MWWSAARSWHGCCVEGEAGREAGCGGQKLGRILRAGMGTRRSLASLHSSADTPSLLGPRASICQIPVKGLRGSWTSWTPLQKPECGAVVPSKALCFPTEPPTTPAEGLEAL